MADQLQDYFTSGDNRFNTLSQKGREFYDLQDPETRDSEMDKRHASMWLAKRAFGNVNRYQFVMDNFDGFARQNFDSSDLSKVYAEIGKRYAEMQGKRPIKSKTPVLDKARYAWDVPSLAAEGLGRGTRQLAAGTEHAIGDTSQVVGDFIERGAESLAYSLEMTDEDRIELMDYREKLRNATSEEATTGIVKSLLGGDMSVSTFEDVSASQNAVEEEFRGKLTAKVEEIVARSKEGIVGGSLDFTARTGNWVKEYGEEASKIGDWIVEIDKEYGDLEYIGENVRRSIVGKATTVISESLPMIISLMNPATSPLGAATMYEYVRQAEKEMVEAKGEVFDPKKNYGSRAFLTAVQIAIERMLGVNRAADKVFSMFKNKSVRETVAYMGKVENLKAVLKAAGMSGLEEAVEEPLQGAAEEFRNMFIDDDFDMTLEEFVKARGVDAFYGGIAGFVMGGAVTFKGNQDVKAELQHDFMAKDGTPFGFKEMSGSLRRVRSDKELRQMGESAGIGDTILKAANGDKAAYDTYKDSMLEAIPDTEIVAGNRHDTDQVVFTHKGSTYVFDEFSGSTAIDLENATTAEQVKALQQATPMLAAVREHNEAVEAKAPKGTYVVPVMVDLPASSDGGRIPAGRVEAPAQSEKGGKHLLIDPITSEPIGEFDTKDAANNAAWEWQQTKLDELAGATKSTLDYLIGLHGGQSADVVKNQSLRAMVDIGEMTRDQAVSTARSSAPKITQGMTDDQVLDNMSVAGTSTASLEGVELIAWLSGLTSSSRGEVSAADHVARIAVLGKSPQAVFTKIGKAVNRISNKASPLAPIEEVSESYLKLLSIADGAEAGTLSPAVRSMVMSWREQWEAETGNDGGEGYNKSDSGLIEWFSSRTIDYVTSTYAMNDKAAERALFPDELKGFMALVRRFAKVIWDKAELMVKMRRNGNLPQDMEGAMRKLLGMPSDFTMKDEAALRAAGYDIYETDQSNRSQSRGDGSGRPTSGQLTALQGTPKIEGATGPNEALVKVAEDYARSIGIDVKRQAEYVKVDVDRAARIAQAYEEMEHAPSDPIVREAYDDLIQQTMDQYRALEAAGFDFWFIDPSNDKGYGDSPYNAMRDLRANKSMGVYPTEAGFGSGDSELDVSDNPLMLDTGIEWAYGSSEGKKRRVLANDLFRAVHDAFGHGLEGSGFRARGEENAWQAHIRLFQGSAVGAMTSETRGQNSWLNFGKHGDHNQTAKVEDTIFADQKTGLMPSWTWEEGRAAPMSDATFQVTRNAEESAFYSQLERTLDAKIQGKAATAQQIKGLLDPKHGIKADEVKWSGIEQWLDDNKDSKGKVAKDDLMAYLRDVGRVKFEEVTRGNGNLKIDYDSPFAVPRVIELGKEWQGEADDALALRIENDREAFDQLKALDPQIVQREDWAETVAMNVFYGTGNATDTRYSRYVLPNGENYREVVLTMPVVTKGLVTFDAEKAKTLLSSGVKVAGVKDGIGVQRVDFNPEAGTARSTLDEYTEFATLDDVIAHNERLAESRQKRSSEYTSSHFADIPNYVAHMRLNERDGGLFIEELQSDRHQTARKSGYRGDTPEISAEEALATRDEIYRAHDAGEISREEFIRRMEAWKPKTSVQDLIADAPFRKDWHIQMFKRALRDAVASGKSWIGWTTGETQAGRYDLSKQVESIEYKKNGENYTVGVNGQSRQSIYYNHKATVSELSDTIGKELAQKIVDTAVEGETKKIEGNGLKVGGEGMKGFYDRMMVNDVNGYLKKLDSKNKPKVEAGVIEEQVGGWSVVDSKGNQVVDDVYNSESDAMVVMRQRGMKWSEGYRAANQGAVTAPIHRVTITDAMRDSVQQGQPTFQVVPMVHFSRVAGLDYLDPNFHGSGINGTEKRLKQEYPDLFMDRIYIGTDDYEKEPNLPDNFYAMKIEEGLLYDFENDPEEFRSKAALDVRQRKTKYAPFDSRAAGLIAERKIIDAGYLGYVVKGREAAAIFHRIPTGESLTSEWWSDIKAYREGKAASFTSRVQEQLDRLKVVPRKDEDGATLNVDGTNYEGGGLVITVNSVNTNSWTITPAMVQSFLESNREVIFSNASKIGLYKFPDSADILIDLNVVVPAANRAVALEFGKLAGQESLFDLDTPENVKTGESGESPMSFTFEQYREIAESLEAGVLPRAVGGAGVVMSQSLPQEPTLQITVSDEVFNAHHGGSAEVVRMEAAERESNEQREKLDMPYFAEEQARQRKNQEQLKGDFSERGLLGWLYARNGLSMGSRLRNVHVRIFSRMREYRLNVSQRKMRYSDRVQPARDLYRQLDKADRKALGLHLANGDQEQAMLIMDKVDGLAEAIRQTRIVLDEIRRYAIASGYEIPKRDNYWPRWLQDRDGLLAEFGMEVKGIFDTAIESAKLEASARGHTLTDADKEKIIGQILAGTYKGSGIPPNFKARSIETLEQSQFDEFYSTPFEAVDRYINRVVDDVEKKKFFGQSAIVEDVNGTKKVNVEKSAASVVADLVAKGELVGAEQAEVQTILEAMHTNGAMQKGLQVLRSLGYIATMMKFEVAMIQIEDISTAVFTGRGFGNLRYFASLFDKDEMSMVRDFGQESFSQDYDDAKKGMARFMDWGMKKSGVAFFGRGGANTQVNSGIRAYRDSAQRGRLTDTQERRLTEYFGGDAARIAQLKQDLIDNVKSEDVVLLGWNILLDFQPLDYSEMPEGYAKHPNLRIFYMLKTFMLKRFDIMRREGIREMKLGVEKRDYKLFRDGMRKLMWLYMLWFVGGATVDFIRDTLSGKEPKVDDTLAASAIKILGVNRFLYYDFQRHKNPVLSLAMLTSFPVPWFQQIYRDSSSIVTGDSDWSIGNAEVWRSVPFVGSMYYWHAGGGEQRQREEERKETRRRMREMGVQMP